MTNEQWNDAEDAADHESTEAYYEYECQACGNSTPTWIYPLGRLLWAKCRACGFQQSAERP